MVPTLDIISICLYMSLRVKRPLIRRWVKRMASSWSMSSGAVDETLNVIHAEQTRDGAVRLNFSRSWMRSPTPM